jgi:hypothetical protein
VQGAIALTQYMLGSTITLVRVIISGHRTYIMIIIMTIITIIIAIAVAVEEVVDPPVESLLLLATQLPHLLDP